MTTATRTRHIPGEEGIWAFIFGDLVIFAVFFLTFIFTAVKTRSFTPRNRRF